MRAEEPTTPDQALLEAGERIARIGSWQWNSDEILWSKNLFRLFGFEPGEVAPSPELIMERVHPDDRASQARRIEEIRDGGEPPSSDYRLVLPEGGVRHLRSTVTQVDGSGDRQGYSTGTVQDITERWRAEREIALHVAVEEALDEWESFEPGTEGLIRGLALAMESVGGTLWVPQGDRLVARVVWSSDEVGLAEFEGAVRRLRLAPGSPLPGMVWASGKSFSFEIGREGSYLERREAALRAGLRGVLAVPIVTGEEVLAVLELYSREEVDLTDRLERSLTGISHELGHFLERRRGELGPSPLTPRELEVLRSAAQGNSGREIAEQLAIRPSTVKTHLDHIYEKLGAGDRASAVATALRLGLIH